MRPVHLLPASSVTAAFTEPGSRWIGAFLEGKTPLAHLHAHGVKPVRGPLIHGFEGGGNLGGSGSRLEIFTDTMRVPNGEEFPAKNTPRP